MGIRWIIIFVLLMPIVGASSVRINEVMYNPEGDDYDFEYIELYGNGENISGWYFEGIGFSFPLNTSISGYLIIANTLNDSGENNDFLDKYPNVSCNFEYTGSLLNDGENISIKNSDGNVIDSVFYSDLAKEGYSLEFYEGSWQESINIGGTPGAENSYSEEIIVNNCDWGVDIVSDIIFENESDFTFITRVLNFEEGKINITIIRLIEDLYGNVIKSYNNLTCEAIYDKNCAKNEPNLDSGIYLIKVSIFPDCEDTDLSNNYKEKLIVILKEEEFIVQDYTKIKINELFPDPEGSDTTAMPSGEWVELYNSGSSALDLENLSLKDNYGQSMDIFISNSNTFSTIINPNSYLVVYMNGLFGFLNNNDFEKISLYKDDYLLDEVSYSGSTEDLTWNKINDKWVLSLPTPSAENYNNESDITSSRIRIDKVYDLGSDNIAKFGQIIKIKLEIYKGDTNKESIKLYVEKEDGDRISKESKANVEDKFTNYTLSVPIQLIPNCNKEFDDGIYNIIVSGLEDSDVEEIEIEGITSSLCEVVKENRESIKENVGSSNENVLNQEVTGNVVYEGESEKQLKYSVYFFCFSLIMLIMYLIIKNEQ